MVSLIVGLCLQLLPPGDLDQAIVPWIISWIWQIFISSISRIRPSQQQRVLPMQLPGKKPCIMHMQTQMYMYKYMYLPIYT